VEDKIILHLIKSDEYYNKIFPYLKEIYFADNNNALKIYRLIKQFEERKYTKIGINDITSYADRTRNTILKQYCNKIQKDPIVDTIEYLIDETESFIRKEDLKNSMISSIEILQSSKEFTDKEASKIEELINNSLRIHFDNSVGLDSDDIDKKLEYYKKQQEQGFLTSLPTLNKMLDGGFKRKTLSVFAAPPGLGKSTSLSHHAVDFLINGYNVLYITLEMSELDISKRIDSNLYNIKYNELKNVDDEVFRSKANELKNKGLGRLIIKEYPTGGANSSHIKGLLKELEQKKNFIADIIIVDYIGIMSETASDMYNNIKKNSEGLRAIAVENNCHVMSAVQTNRGGIDKSNMSFADLAESTGPAQIADFLCFIVKIDFSDDENTDNNKNILKQNILLQIRKNRYGGLSNTNILVQQDFEHFRLTESKHEIDMINEDKILDKNEIISSLGKKDLNNTNNVNGPFVF